MRSPAQASALAASIRGATSQIRRADVEAFLGRHGASILAALMALAVSLLLVGRGEQQGVPLHSYPSSMVGPPDSLASLRVCKLHTSMLPSFGRLGPGMHLGASSALQGSPLLRTIKCSGLH
jgi:hypothetical protein